MIIGFGVFALIVTGIGYCCCKVAGECEKKTKGE